MSPLSPARWVAVVLTALTLTATALPATAADAPPNDDRSQATRLGIRPQTVREDTRRATYDTAGDPECTAGASVWYRMRVRKERTVRLSTLGSSYDTVLAVFTGTPLSTVACNDDSIGLLTTSAVRVTLRPRTTYFVAVSSCCAANSGGGDLRLNVVAKDKLTSSTKVRSAKAGPVSGRAFVTGSQRCDHPSAFQVTATLSQRVDQWVARGSRSTVIPFCHGVRRFGLRFDSRTGVAFQPGHRAVLTLQTYVTDSFQTVAPAKVTRVVRLGTGRGAAQRVTGIRVPAGRLALKPTQG